MSGDARQGRRFGLTLGLAFLALAGVSRWRGHHLPPIILASLGAALLLAALAAPVGLVPVERAWMALARAMSRVTTPLAMGALYFGLLTPVALLRRALGRSSIARARGAGTYWVDRPPGQRRSDLSRQF